MIRSFGHDSSFNTKFEGGRGRIVERARQMMLLFDGGISVCNDVDAEREQPQIRHDM